MQMSFLVSEFRFPYFLIRRQIGVPVVPLAGFLLDGDKRHPFLQIRVRLDSRNRADSAYKVIHAVRNVQGSRNVNFVADFWNVHREYPFTPCAPEVQKS